MNYSTLLFLFFGCLCLISCGVCSDITISPKVSLQDAFPKLRFSSAVAFLTNPKDDDLVYVVQLSGEVFCFKNKETTVPSQMNTFLNISDKVTLTGEMGLLGLAFHPNFPDTPYIYVHYDRALEDQNWTIISRFTARSQTKVDLDSELQILNIPQPFITQKGGPIFFDKHGYLMIGLGDGGSNGDPLGNGQNRTSLLGKMLRIDIDNPEEPYGSYSIPEDNPFVHEADVRKEIYALGLRNPWRCSYDKVDDNIWCADVGESSWEEVDIITSGGNYGWNTTEGPTCFSKTNCDLGSFSSPVYWYPHPSLNLPTLFSGSALIGGTVYRGKGIPKLEGSYVFADFISPKIGYLKKKDGIWRDKVLIPDAGKLLIIGFGQDASKELYVLSYGDDQPIYQLKLHSCGNGKVDEDEQCDFGDRSEKVWKKRCCEKRTCRSLKRDKHGRC